jgi:hypothetical protein
MDGRGGLPKGSGEVRKAHSAWNTAEDFANFECLVDGCAGTARTGDRKRRFHYVERRFRILTLPLAPFPVKALQAYH